MSCGKRSGGRLRPRAAAVLTLVLWFLAISLPSSAATTSGGTSPTAVRFSERTVAHGPAAVGEIPSMPSLAAHDEVDAQGGLRKRITLGFSQNEDLPVLESDYGTLTSTDGGLTFPLASKTERGTRALNRVRLPDGDLLDVRFEPTSVVDWDTTAPGQERRFVQVRANRSADGGRTWTQLARECFSPAPRYVGEACLELDAPLKRGHNVRFFRGIVSFLPTPGAAAPVLLMPLCAEFADDPPGTCRVQVAQSTDEGLSWTTRGTIGLPAGLAGTPYSVSYSETTLIQLKTGELYAVMRRDARDAIGVRRRYLPHAYSMSRDGITWSPPREVMVTPEGSTPQPWTGVAPTVELMPNGVYVMTSGRLDNHLAVADSALPDGSPRWTGTWLLHENFPSSGQAVRTRGSSGYVGLVPVASNRLLVAMDNCGPTPWGCPSASRDWVTDGRHRLLTRHVDVLTSDRGKIDLYGKLRSGRISLVRNDFTWRHRDHPETRPEGAFDGSVEPWSSAMAAATGRAAEMVVRLDRDYSLTRLGLSLHHGRPARARVFVSLDPDRFGWTPWEHGEVTRTSRSLDYFPLSPGTRARYVRVVVAPSSTCAPDVGDGCVSLNELELYSTAVNAFENDGVGHRSTDYASSRSAWTTQADGRDGSRALRIKDTSTSTTAFATSNTTSRAARRTLQADVRQVTATSGLLVKLEGAAPDRRPVTAYGLSVSPTGGLRVLRGGRWDPSDLPGTGGLFSRGAWRTLRIEADLTTARVFVDGRRVAVVPANTAVAELTKHTFSSAGQSAVGHYLVDEVIYQ